MQSGWHPPAAPTTTNSSPAANVPQVALRVHDACFTSEVLGSLKCDCAEQLQMSMEYIHANSPGIVIYLWQEGRGIGLANKIAAYKLQEQGLDTVDANRALGLPDDSREYTSVRNILKELNVKSVRLMTNNPRKINELGDLGVKVTGRIPCQIQAGDFNKVRRPGLCSRRPAAFGARAAACMHIDPLTLTCGHPFSLAAPIRVTWRPRSTACSTRLRRGTFPTETTAPKPEAGAPPPPATGPQIVQHHG